MPLSRDLKHMWNVQNITGAYFNSSHVSKCGLNRCEKLHTLHVKRWFSYVKHLKISRLYHVKRLHVWLTCTMCFTLFVRLLFSQHYTRKRLWHFTFRVFFFLELGAKFCWDCNRFLLQLHELQKSNSEGMWSSWFSRWRRLCAVIFYMDVKTWLWTNRKSDSQTRLSRLFISQPVQLKRDNFTVHLLLLESGA